ERHGQSPENPRRATARRPAPRRLPWPACPAPRRQSCPPACRRQQGEGGGAHRLTVKPQWRICPQATAADAEVVDAGQGRSRGTSRPCSRRRQPQSPTLRGIWTRNDVIYLVI
uniref:Uncharacterized protein n=5 Tax=Aegilops tauschii subsp. strangulata TaxID=200361 RepID=A0A453QM12_AEGTS